MVQRSFVDGIPLKRKASMQTHRITHIPCGAFANERKQFALEKLDKLQWMPGDGC
jgi:hypothetical protein